MILWKKEYHRPNAEEQYRRVQLLKHYNVQASWSVAYKRHDLEWVLPYPVAVRLKYNKNNLPVVQHREQSNEAYYLYLSIRRIILGYRA